MRVLVVLALIVAIAIALWRAREQRHRATLRFANAGRTVHLPTPGPLGETEPSEKPVGEQLGFLHDLKRREREARRPEQHRAPPSVGRETIIDAEFRDVSDRDSQT